MQNICQTLKCYGSQLKHCYAGVLAIMAKLYKEAMATESLPSLKMPPKRSFGLRGKPTKGINDKALLFNHLRSRKK